jgi:hypothetical protein
MKTEGTYELEIIGDGDDRQIRFVNHSPNFVEVVFSVNGIHLKDGKRVTTETRGYAYHPRDDRRLTKTTDKRPLSLGKHGVLEAVVYEGSGTPVDESVEMPPFIRKRIGSKVRVRRFSNVPSDTIQLQY